jgi:hypothetical protein
VSVVGEIVAELGLEGLELAPEDEPPRVDDSRRRFVQVNSALREFAAQFAEGHTRRRRPFASHQ